ncbi:UNVERIFIED_CONTAM: hypothetical protein HDU68_003285 [Siphonaria sp. JEL0065]|nr:hypothetical protein HDU68_003285 [Siphonaria sp. JEL0065]
MNIFDNLQYDLVKLRLLSVKALAALNLRNVNPISNTTHLKLDSFIKGMGPTWRIYMVVTNTGKEGHPPTYITISADPELYRIEYPGIEVATLESGESVNLSTFIHALDDNGLIADENARVVEVCLVEDKVVAELLVSQKLVFQ